jgi:hypothetical protein
MIMKQNNDFYIGWMDKAPASYSRHIKKVIILLACLVLIAALILSLQQRKFSTASFEFGQLTEITGTYQQAPVPAVKVKTDQDVFGNSTYLTIPLVGYGKFGAEGIISSLEKEHNTPLNGKEVVLKGTLLYSDGKTLLQVDKNDNPLVSINKPLLKTLTTRQDLGFVEVKGEIIDPKCYFGVMKPGHGKPHRDCAIRCIEGGMDPVFYVRNDKGEANYYLIVGADGRKINDQLKDYIAEPVSLKAKAVQIDDWTVLYLDGNTSIKRLGGLSWFKQQDNSISCSPR